jgi:hypothetical protein
VVCSIVGRTSLIFTVFLSSWRSRVPDAPLVHVTRSLLLLSLAVSCLHIDLRLYVAVLVLGDRHSCMGGRMSYNHVIHCHVTQTKAVKSASRTPSFYLAP